ncbi:male gamete fusion factor (macronuclear) [Tetrahymena thermophila SB210]|uniref:Hapless 2 n=2 Tax=Tetrahymena thermophila TaxID=5911 RepID=HAP2_TETTH|nr:male gamete fusion factor [Tetrahymena thermophila SB210]A0A060A682.1 RecName: Full=Hapless 2; AltName: Full=Generative cell specific-1; Flags: Precursor [Tetrahymena thermophila]AIA57699.1 hapless 2 generative cell-specific 1 [Tetrahymena thermophila]EAR82880.2 male gamete fusion factor [Tetrahymena thermophila SB210]|eukprot:XP_001030543.2 male gamete fusion factor [Tetrahymena thermophila SB210]
MKFLAFGLIYFHFCILNRCEYITSSTIQKCYNSSNEPNNCSQKAVIVLSLENGQIANTEQVVATLNQLSDSGVNKQLQNSFIFEVTKSPVTALFPLIYLQDFNSQPLEQVIATTLFSCKDGFYDSSPTCKFQYDSKGQKILDSQGYCCYCSLSDILGMGNDLSRGKVCYALNLGAGSATAHCLKFSPLWYSAFKIQQYQLYFEVNINIYTVDSQNQKNLKQTLKLSTSNPTMKSSDNSTISKIIGTFTPTQPPADLSSYYLVKPSFPATDPRVLQGISSWMFVDKTMFTLDGTQCNKIGVSYSGFRQQSSSCSQPVGSCLQNQLENLYQSDLILLSQNKQPKYLLESQGNFNQVQFQGQTILQQGLSGSASTLITIEIDAAQIKFVTNLGIGCISQCSINNFESHSGNGKLVALVQNQGNYSAEFVLGFNCSSNVQPIQGQKLFLTANQLYNFNCSVSVNSDISAINNNCTINLYDAIGNQLDSKNILFNTTSTNHTSNQGNNTGQQQSSQEYKSSQSCSDKCSSFWSFWCYFSAGCIKEAFKSIASIAGVASALALVIFLAKNGYLVPIIRFLCCCCCKSKKKENEKNKDKTDKKSIQESCSYDRSCCSHSISQSYQVENKNKYKRSKIQRSFSSESCQDKSKKIINELSNLEETFEANKLYANIDKNSSIFEYFGFKKSFTFILYERNDILFLPQNSTILDMIGALQPQKGSYLAQKFLEIVNKNALKVVSTSPLYLLIE